MNYQTVFYNPATGHIINVVQNKYIRSKFEKLRFCPGYTHTEVNFLHYKHDIPIDPEKHTVKRISATIPPIIIDARGVNLIYKSVMTPFLQIRYLFQDFVVDMADGMGDKLYRAAAVLEAQKQYPDKRFFCKVEAEHKEIITLIPNITIFDSFKAHNLDPKKTGTIQMPAAFFINPQDLTFSAPSGYGLYLGLDYTPYNVKLTIPPNFDQELETFSQTWRIRKDGHNIAMQLRTKDEETRSWDARKAIELATMIKSVYDCNIYYSGSPRDMPLEHSSIINLCGKTTWLETVYLLRQCSHIFCIDSATLHLCHALGITPYRLWGRTNPESVIDEPPGDTDIFSDIPGQPSQIKDITSQKVFSKAFPTEVPKVSYIFDPAQDHSEHGDQEIIFKYFTDHPPIHNQLVDVGAFGKQHSNSFALLEKGWKGLLIEANPDRIKVIEKEFKGLNTTILNIGIDSRHGKFPFYLHSTPGQDSLDANWYPETKTTRVIMIDVYPLSEILTEAEIPFDFDMLSLDTEGLDEKIIKKLFNTSDYRPSLIVIEWGQTEDNSGLFKRFGYEQIGKTGVPGYENLFFARAER